MKFFSDTTRPFTFVTFCTHRRQKILATDQTHSAFVQFAQQAAEFKIAGGRYVVIPDHSHLFVCGNEEFVLSRWVAMLKQVLAKKNGWRKSSGQIWEEGFFDHVLRSDESMSEKWEYIQQNPVRAGVVNDPDDWPYQGEIVLMIAFS
jgi:putative transposase